MIRTKIFLLFTLLCTGALLAAPVVAQPAGGGPHGPHGFHGGPGHGGPGHGPGPFFGADADEDGAVSQAELDAILASVDTDGDGILSHEELQAHHRALREADAEADDSPRGRRGPRQRMMRHMMMRLDADGDGQIQTSEVQAHFDELDADGDGVVSADELPCLRCGHAKRLFGAAALKGADADQDGDVTLSEWNAFLATVDADGDGRVSLTELRDRIHPDREPPSVAVEDLDATFDRLDENGDGVVSADELPRRRGPRR